MTEEHKHIYRLIDLVKALPNVAWNYQYLLGNSNINLTEIIENPDLIQKAGNISKIVRNDNITLNFILNNMDKSTLHDADWKMLSMFLPARDIQAHPELPWDYKTLSGRSDFWLVYILKNPQFDWSWNILSHVKSIKLIEKNITLPWNVKSISSNKTLTLEFIRQHPEIPWNFKIVSFWINIREIQKDLDAKSDIENDEKTLPWNFESLSSNFTLTSSFILAHLNENWDFHHLSANTNLNFNRLVGLSGSSSSLGWDWEVLSNNPKLTKKFLLFHIEHFTSSTQWYNIYQNNTVNLKDIENDPKLFHSYDTLSSHPELTADYILSHGEISEWNSMQLSMNGGLKMIDYEKLLKAGFDLIFYTISRSPNLTYDFIYQHPDLSWRWNSISLNRFRLENTKEKLVLRLQKNYIKKQKRLAYQVLNPYIIPDVNNIVIEY